MVFEVYRFFGPLLHLSYLPMVNCLSVPTSVCLSSALAMVAEAFMMVLVGSGSGGDWVAIWSLPAIVIVRVEEVSMCGVNKGARNES